MTLLQVLAGLGALGGLAGFAGLLKVWLNHKAEKRKQTDEVALSLVRTLTERVARLETDIAADRQHCDEKLDEQASAYNARLARQEAEMRLLRHTKNRLIQLIYSSLHLFDVPARQRKPLLDRAHSELDAILSADALEKGAMLGATLTEEPEK